MRLEGLTQCVVRRTSRSGALALASLCCVQAGTALAQPSAPETLERVIVTGSNIPRIDGETPLPVQIITREEIERSGVTTAAQLLERVPANINGFNDALTIQRTGQAGLSAANLRGLGGGSTLVLLNGRRLANYAFAGDTVDLNSIPLAAVERVEVLKDGASAIYGSDALAGVINFILRKDYVGAEVTAYGAVTQQGGGNNVLATASFGTGELARDGYNAFVTASYQSNQALKAADREFADTGYRPELGVDFRSTNTFPANILAGRRILNPTFAQGCAPPSSVPRPPAACVYDASAEIDLLPAIERTSVLARGTWRWSANTDVFAETLVSRNQFEITIAPTPISRFTVVGPNVYPASGPYYPTAWAAVHGVTGDLSLLYRAAELGPRITDTDSEAQRYVLGIEGLAGGWEYTVAGVYSRNTQSTNFKSGFVYIDRLIPAMATGLINPFGASGPDGQALLASTQFYGTLHSAEGTTSLINAVASREIAALPAGALALALGAEARREKLDNVWEPVLVSGFSEADAPRSVSGSRTAYALFAELNVPIVRGLEAQLALRYDDYSDFGSTTNPKVAARWQPLPALLVRGSWGTGFRAPPLYDLYRPRATTGAVDIVDPIRCPITGSPIDCDVDLAILFGGNPDLEPETSKQWNVGVVLEPAPGLSLGIDYWQIEQNDVIGNIGPPLGLTYYGTYGWRAIRGPVDPLYPNLPGPLIGFDDTLMNLGTTRTSGIDVSFAWTAPPMERGTVRVSLQGTYVLKWETQLEGATEISALGTDALLSAIPRWRSQFTLNWNSGPWGATLAQTYTSGYSDFRPDLSGQPRDVSAFAPWDVQGSYSGFRGWQLVGGIRNLFDRDPPVSNQTLSFQIGYNPLLANPLGRLFYLRATYAWD